MTIASYPLVTLLLSRAFLRKEDLRPQQSELTEQPTSYQRSGIAMRCPRILARVICCGLARVRKMDELAEDRFRRLEQTLRPVGGNRALHAPYLSFAIPVGIGSVAGSRAVVLRSILLPA
jgi:hypothetical protein